MAHIFRLKIKVQDQEHVFPIPEGVTVVGRDPSVNLVLKTEMVSRRHAQITRQGETCQVTDLGSANGTFVNGVRLAPNAPAPLVDGAVLRFAQVELRFEVAEAPAAEEKPSVKPEVAAPVVPPPPAKEKPKPPAKKVDIPAEPPVEPPPPAKTLPPAPSSGELPIPPGLELHSQRLMQYLPGIYHTDFMSRFLGLFEAILTPIEWNIENFDLYLDPDSSPAFFLDWLANWYQAGFDSTWTEEQRRQFLREAHALYAARGTRKALSRLLEIYTGAAPEIIDDDAKLEPYTFKVRIRAPASKVNKELVQRLIDAHKPAYTTYTLEF